MVERKLYKTKLCVLYKRGHCPRQSCSFAHGDAELRRFSGSFNGRREYRDNDLRDKLDRRHSPQRRYSPGRDARGRHAFHGDKQILYDRGYSRSRSPGKRSERRHKKNQHIDGQSDISGSLKISDGADGVKERKVTSHNAKNVFEEQLKQVQLDIDTLDGHKCQLETFLEEKAQEADSLASRNEELVTQLTKEQEDCKRITSKLKKFIKAHSRYLRAQEELKRSQARLQKLGDQLPSDASKPSANEEDSSLNIASDGEPNCDNGMNLRMEFQNHTSPIKKRPWISLGASEEAKQAILRKNLVGTSKLEKLIPWDGPGNQSDNNVKETVAVNKILIGSSGHGTIANEDNNKRRKNGSSIASVEKVKGLESCHVLPSTSMAAHAIDDLIEMEKIEVVEEKTILPYLLPPPPAAPRKAYNQYEGEDEDVDVEEVDLESRDVDINSEVDIEQL